MLSLVNMNCFWITNKKKCKNPKSLCPNRINKTDNFLTSLSLTPKVLGSYCFFDWVTCDDCQKESERIIWTVWHCLKKAYTAGRWGNYFCFIRYIRCALFSVPSSCFVIYLCCLAIYISCRVYLEHPQFHCTCTVTIKGYSVLFIIYLEARGTLRTQCRHKVYVNTTMTTIFYTSIFYDTYSLFWKWSMVLSQSNSFTLSDIPRAFLMEVLGFPGGLAWSAWLAISNTFSTWPVFSLGFQVTHRAHVPSFLVKHC